MDKLYITNYGDDFYRFVNNNWIENTQIPDEHQRWGTFQILSEETNEKVKKLVENSLNLPDNNLRKIGILYNQLIDINERKNPSNLFEIQKIINIIESSIDINELLERIIRLDLLFGFNNVIGMVISADYSNPNENILHIVSSGLGLPDRDYYFNIEKQELCEEYIKFIKKYCLLFNKNIDSELVFNFERKLAEKTYTNTQKRNPDLLNNPTTWVDLVSKYNNLKFINNIFIKAERIGGKINVTNPNYIELVNNLIETTSLSEWKQYFIVRILLEFNKYLDDNIRQIYFDFYETKLSGTKKMRPEWKLALDILDTSLGELVGQLYVSKYFNEESKMLAYDIFTYIKDELEKYLRSNDWMEKETKEKALEKLKKMNIKIGYPEKLSKNYDLLDVNESYSLLQNILNVRHFNIEYRLNKLYKPVDKSVWYMPPHFVNAYYSPLLNEIVFPAGILQKPFFSIDQDIALNFGAFGMVIGHEITHGFDDQGCKFDAYGKLNGWWTENDKIKYKTKTEVIRKQYSEYIIEGKNVNGELTLGENIADIGGLGLSVNAFKSYVSKNRKDLDINKELAKLFINYAELWKNKARKEDTLKRLTIDPHSPPEFRVNGVLRNIDDFYRIFNIKSSDKLYLSSEMRARIWI